MEIHNIKHNLSLTKYDNTTFLIKGRSFIEIDFTDEVARSKIRFDIMDDIILDGASVPLFARFFLKTNYEDIDDNLSWIVHDILYMFGSFKATPLSFETSNIMFLELMKQANKPRWWWQRSAMYRAVNSFVGRKCYDTKNTYDENNVKCIKWSWI